MKNVLDSQQKHWEKTYSEEPNLFGGEPSYAAQKAAALFKTEHKNNILELGCGHGRDTIFFAQNGFAICALDYSKTCIQTMARKAQTLRLSKSITAMCHDARRSLPFVTECFDCCYSHMRIAWL